MKKNYSIKTKMEVEVETILGHDFIPTENILMNLINSDLSNAEYSVKNIKILNFNVENHKERISD
ncbi:hypothetical protein [Clostridium sp. YIM B02551]|uniref:hypothetical protein n=1 Tax=Clostridium sp. YIM B02551 TaxID=2910679 RepID=UPI001EEA0BDB|nr:hypothetical protein [Clostridium sp. YIM B02551]